MYIRTAAGFGENPETRDSLWKRVKPERLSQVVNAIYRLPEGSSAAKPRDHAYELRIVGKLKKQGFSPDEIEAGLRLTRKELGLPDPAQIEPSSLPRQTSMGPPEFSKWEYDRALAEHIDWLYRRANMGDDGAAHDLARLLGRILADRRRMENIRRQLTELRSPAEIALRVEPEPPAPTPDPPSQWRLPPRLVTRGR